MSDLWTATDQEALVSEVGKVCSVFAAEHAAYDAMPRRRWDDPLWSQGEVDARVRRINEAIATVHAAAAPLRTLGDKVERLFNAGGAQRASLHAPAVGVA